MDDELLEFVKREPDKARFYHRVTQLEYCGDYLLQTNDSESMRVGQEFLDACKLVMRFYRETARERDDKTHAGRWHEQLADLSDHFERIYCDVERLVKKR